jgi:uncharacterized protein (TIRG00374 family)
MQMNRLNAILLILGVVFLICLVWTIGFGELWHQLTSLGWGLIPLILIEGVADLAHTVGWRRCLSGPYRSLPLVVLFCIRMAGFAINYLTPTASLGGEVTKAALLASNHRGPEATSGVLIGKLCFAFAHLLFVAMGSLTILWRIQLPRALWVAMLISSASVAGGMVAFLLIQKYGKLGVVIRWLVARKLGGRLLERAAWNITEVDEALKLFYQTRPWDLALGVCWHLLGYSVGIFQTWLFFYLLNQDVSLVVAAGVSVLCSWFDLLTFAIPRSLGTLEGSRIVAFKAAGYDAVLGMTYGVTLRLAELFWAGFGLVSYGLLSRAGHLRDA